MQCGSSPPGTPIPPTPSGKGYFIVGGGFWMQNETSTSASAVDETTVWGTNTERRALMGSGYCWNRFLGQRGYGTIYVSLKPVEEVSPDTLVVAGGWTWFLRADRQNGASQTPPPVPSPNSPWKRQTEWAKGRQLDNLGVTEQLAGHFDARGASPDVDGYGKIYFALMRASSVDVNNRPQQNGVQVFGGYTSIGDAAHGNTYSARDWGQKGPQVQGAGAARTWPQDHPTKPGVSYSNAYSFINVYTN